MRVQLKVDGETKPKPSYDRAVIYLFDIDDLSLELQEVKEKEGTSEEWHEALDTEVIRLIKENGGGSAFTYGWCFAEDFPGGVR